MGKGAESTERARQTAPTPSLVPPSSRLAFPEASRCRAGLQAPEKELIVNVLGFVATWSLWKPLNSVVA